METKGGSCSDSTDDVDTRTSHLSVDLFKGTDDPFGDEFEESLRTAPKIPVKRSSLSSSGSGKEVSSPTCSLGSTATCSGGSSATSPIKEATDSIYNWPVWPPLPVKQVNRSHSQLSQRSNGQPASLNRSVSQVSSRHSVSSSASSVSLRNQHSLEQEESDSTYCQPAFPPLPAKQRLLSQTSRNSDSSLESERTHQPSRQESYDEVTIKYNQTEASINQKESSEHDSQSHTPDEFYSAPPSLNQSADSRAPSWKQSADFAPFSDWTPAAADQEFGSPGFLDTAPSLFPSSLGTRRSSRTSSVCSDSAVVPLTAGSRASVASSCAGQPGPLSGAGTQRSAENDQEKKMTIVESTISSVPTLISSNVGVRCGVESDIYNPYEDITEIRKSIKDRALNKGTNPPPPPPRNSVTKTPDQPVKPEQQTSAKPDPPPRKSVPKPDKDKPEGLYDRPETVENVYSEPAAPVRDTLGGGDNCVVKREDNTNLFDRLIAEQPAMDTGASLALASGQLGAKPKSKVGTLDIRNTVYQWYEEAVQEVERDLSLDINHLEQNPGLPRRLRKHNYEPVYSTREIQPSTTLLRDFDPCFDEVAEEDSEDSEAEEDEEAAQHHVTNVEVDGGNVSLEHHHRHEVPHDSPPQRASTDRGVVRLNKQMLSVIRRADDDNNSVVVNSNHSSRSDKSVNPNTVTSVGAVNGDTAKVGGKRRGDRSVSVSSSGGGDDVDEIKASIKIAAASNTGAAGGSSSSDAAKTGDEAGKSGGFPGIKFGSPKRLNFGPPKPPRHFEYSSLSSQSNAVVGGGGPSEKQRKDSKIRSPKDIFGGKRKSKVVIGGGADFEAKKKEDQQKEGETDLAVTENLYVTLPCDRGDDRSPRSNEQSPQSTWSSHRSHKRTSLFPDTCGDVQPMSGSESSPSPPLTGCSPSPPPPLPTSPPPRAIRPKQTMYENVWIERSSPDSETGRSKSLGSLNSDTKGGGGSEEEGSSTTSTRSPPALPPRRGSQLSGSITTKTESFGSQSSLATSGSNTSGSQNSKETASNADSKDVKAALKKLSSGRSFSVSNLKLPRLPSMAENLKKKVTDQLRSAADSVSPAGPLASSSDLNVSPILGEAGGGLDDTDEDDLNSSVAELSLFSGAKSLHLPEWDALTTASNSSRHFSCGVFLFSSRKKQYQMKWLVMGNGAVKLFNEENVLSKPKEIIMLNNIFTISKKSEKHMGPEFQELHCFNIAALNSNGKLKKYTLGCISSTERNNVMEKIVQSLGTRLNNFDISDATKIGWAYMKVGFAAEWSLSWLYLTSSQLGFATQQSTNFQTINLKKTKETSVKKDVKTLDPPVGFSKHPALVIDFNDRTVYILPGAPSEVCTWKTSIEQIAFTNTNLLSDQQVTHENVPVLVDKCLKFVFSHGVMTEGIYRLAGVNTKINKLLSEFRSNAWTVEISREDYSEHDVANVLKRFVRQLEAPLLTNELRQDFLLASRIQQQDTRISKLKTLLSQLPDVNYATTRKLLGHLYTVSSQSDKNLMPVYNLAPLWGPNMLLVDGQAGQGFGETREETDVCADLISNYPYLFDVDMEELDKEKKLLEVLEKINYPTPSTVKRSGDVMMWCYLECRSAGRCVSLTLHPSLTAGEASRQVAREAGLNDLQGMVMHEVVMGECLERPIHYSEKLLDLTLRWGVWEDEDRRNNYLVMKQSALYSDALPCAIPPLSIFSEIQFCDNKPKSKFNKYLFSVANASITYHKEDKNGHTVESQSWPVEDIIWYIGCEKKRAAPHSLNLTFIMKQEHQVRTKETPYFGRVLSFSSRELFTKWIAALLVAEYGTDLHTDSLLMIE